MSFAKNSVGALEVTDTNNYYPFGLNHIGGSSSSNFGSYHSYKYNGKELQETGMYDYGARMYMPDLGRWGVHDPLSETTLQPYSYADNNPIFYNDPTGMIAQQPETIATIYKHKRTGEEVNVNDGVNETVLVNGHDFAKAKTYAKYYDSNRASVYGNSNYEVNQGYIDFYYNTRYGSGFSFASLFDSGPDKRKMPTSDEDTMILLEMPDIGRGPLKSSLKAVGKSLAKKNVGKTSGWIVRKEFNSLDPLLQAKFKHALTKGIVPPKGNIGIIKLTESEAKSTGYTYKLKILHKGGDLRIYGNPLENGHIVFDKIMTH
ncbi:RHS repeat-associated core domain-containing protein [Chryseobacterium joostei]|uniref:RHS repeat-associated core domain-containing protein n=1 Tax=Chryseobacterium joostei TaxID=112234 RepID=A0A1N7I3H5_9FLAO|nr:RHS repeat-associated core domain-containing protein [Chryseobacterium joostei]SIS31607.1 RHS repeat-associated core domain-containing protein [Chryseobacterium joostei]